MSKNNVADMLTTCEQEPINTPGAIQEYGILVALNEPDMRITDISDNAVVLFGLPISHLLGKPIEPLLGRRHLAKLMRYIDNAMWNALQPITLNVRRNRRGQKPLRQPWNVFVHRYDGALIFEFEPTASAAATVPYFRRLREAFGRVHASQTTSEVCQSAADVVRGLTDYDRVMVYRFDSEWNGEVVAEAKREDLSPYLHHHFPSSDIPPQAREAFLRTWVRMIPDVPYKPVPISSTPGRKPLNMGSCLLRAVSPIHIEYLKNMGTGATLTISLKTPAGLWGLIACHHESPKNLLFDARLAGELIGKTVSALLPSRQHMQDERFRRRLAEARVELSSRIDIQGGVREGLETNADLLLQVVDAEGAAVRIDAGKTWMLVGKTPSRRQVTELSRWLSKKMGDEEIFSTDELSRQYERGKALSSKASGLLAVSIPKAEHNFIMWFRPERATTIVWAGDPRKQVSTLSDGTIKIEPRHSFESWKEHVNLHSRPWTNVERSAAIRFRASLVTRDLRHQFKAVQRAVGVRDDFLSIASHELKTPLTSMRLQCQLARRRMDGKDHLYESDLLRVAASIQRVDEGMERVLRLIDDMLDVSRIGTGKLVMYREKTEIVSLTKDLTAMPIC